MCIGIKLLYYTYTHCTHYDYIKELIYLSHLYKIVWLVERTFLHFKSSESEIIKEGRLFFVYIILFYDKVLPSKCYK